ncbi:MAG: hypothetical protein J6P83_07365 [Bacteroidales bacterium]|nr:hypothetical protein [Bacteroidales bacterium]
MKKNKKESYFWTSYSDLMTSLFFVMLVLFILTIVLLRNKMIELERERNIAEGEKAATEAQLTKITELEKSIQNIDTVYFLYNADYKMHVLKTKVKFKSGSANFGDLTFEARQELYAVRDLLKESMESFVKTNPEASYLLIIEGQASFDDYIHNNELSYQRALALFKFWFPNQKTTNLRFYNLPCEVIIAGAGCMEGKPRAPLNEDNQRFLIRILPKPGLIGE